LTKGYHFSEIAGILGEKPLKQGPDSFIDTLLTDSRKLLLPESTLFFAISSPHKNANDFIPHLYRKGVRCFITDNSFRLSAYQELSEANIIVVKDVLAALQRIAGYHRHRFGCRMIGITGSNGKTIVKEWLFHLLSDRYNAVCSPKSYNSQIGVPLSLWQMNEGHEIAIIEAGISEAGEMSRLQKMIDPEIGIVTCIGEAHASGFGSKEQKAREKLSLFCNSSILIYGMDDPMLHQEALRFCAEVNPNLRLFGWGRHENAMLRIREIVFESGFSKIMLHHHGKDFEVLIPFTDDASVSNAITCCALLLILGISPMDITGELKMLRPVEMRLQLKQGINQCSIINDSYSNDLSSFSVAMDFLDQQKQHPTKTVILSDFAETGEVPHTYYRKIADILKQKEVQRFIGVGEMMCLEKEQFSEISYKAFFETTDSLIKEISSIGFSNETILIKGARHFRFEQLTRLLQQKLHDTVMEIDLQALRHNLRHYRKALSPDTRVMAMVKAFSYGSGSFEIANLLQHASVEYLAVAYTDEGAELRKAGIQLPVMVMSPEEAGFEQILSHRLEPEIFSFRMLESFVRFLAERQIVDYPVHLKLDTGMHRLGFLNEEISHLCSLLPSLPQIRVQSVFSHLAGSDDPGLDTFTFIQSELFESMSGRIQEVLPYKILRHLSNSGAVHRHPGLQYDMIRLGIGLYGVDSDSGMQQQLQQVATLQSSISQIKKLKAGDSVGYSRKAIAEKDMTIAVVRIGYADGYPRILSNGAGKMLVNGMLAPVVGSICMDMTMLDITDIPASEGDPVIVFGEGLPVSLLANWAQTIPYEILTGISQRVRRVYFQD
jgi:alanine racemase